MGEIPKRKEKKKERKIGCFSWLRNLKNLRFNPWFACHASNNDEVNGVEALMQSHKLYHTKGSLNLCFSLACFKVYHSKGMKVNMLQLCQDTL